MMFKDILQQIYRGILLICLMTLMTGILYPSFVTGIAQWFFPWQANGSLLTRQGFTVGSLHLGQAFSLPQFFWGRPSLTSKHPYNGYASGGSHLSSNDPRFLTVVEKRYHQLKLWMSEQYPWVPMELLTASGSGLDPEISPQAALFQIPRIAEVRHLPENQLRTLVMTHVSPRLLGIWGEPRVNVLQLNLLLDELDLKHKGKQHV